MEKETNIGTFSTRRVFINFNLCEEKNVFWEENDDQKGEKCFISHEDGKKNI